MKRTEPLFRPTSFNPALASIGDYLNNLDLYKNKHETKKNFDKRCQDLANRKELLMNYMIGLNHTGEDNTWQSTYIEMSTEYEHYFLENQLPKHPNYHTYKMGWTIETQKIEQLVGGLPHPIHEWIYTPWETKTKTSSVKGPNRLHYMDIDTDTTILWIHPDCTKIQALNQIKEMERVSDWVMRSYDSELITGEKDAWTVMGLSGDDDVDYQGSYLDSCIEFLRIILFINTEDDRFLK